MSNFLTSLASNSSFFLSSLYDFIFLDTTKVCSRDVILPSPKIQLYLYVNDPAPLYGLLQKNINTIFHQSFISFLKKVVMMMMMMMMMMMIMMIVINDDDNDDRYY